MTQKEMIENLQVQFPQAGETRLRKMLNASNNKFVDSTRIVQDVAYTTSVKDQLYYYFADFNNSNGGTLRQVRRLTVEDYEDNPYLKYWVEDIDQRIGIGIQEYISGGDVNPLQKSGLTIQINGVYSDPGYGTDLTDEPAYDEAFHMAIVYDVLNDLHAEKGNIQMSEHYHKKYRELEVAAKRYAGSYGIKGNYIIDGQ